MLDELDRSLRDMTRNVARLESAALKLPAERQCQLIGASVEMSTADEEQYRGGGIDGGETVSKDEILDFSQDDYLDRGGGEIVPKDRRDRVECGRLLARVLFVLFPSLFIIVRPDYFFSWNPNVGISAL